MHRFRKKQDLKKQALVGYDNNLTTTNESQVSTSTVNNTSLDLPTLPPASDFRTSLILPTLTKRFSVLRRGESANNSNNVAPTKTISKTQESPLDVFNSRTQPSLFSKNTTTTNGMSKIKSGKKGICDISS